MAPEQAEARASAERLLQVFESCGYQASLRTFTNDNSGREGVFIESPPRVAAGALTIQSAFQSAGIDATVAIRDAGRHDTVIVHLGPRGLP
jgi:hypothetical protein